VSGTCDWGGCDEVAVALRFDRYGHGWLPVCERHSHTVDEEDPAAPLRLAALPDEDNPRSE